MSIVFRLEPAYVEKVFLRPNTKLIQSGCRFRTFTVCSISNHDGRLPVFLQIVVPNHIRVGDDRIRNDRRKVLRNPIVHPSRQSPFPTQALDAVDVQRNRGPRHARHQREGGVCPVTKEDAVEPARQRVKYGKERVCHGIQVLGSDGGKDG